MALSINSALKNSIVNSIITALAGTTGTAGTAQLRIYSGNQPANADAGTSGTLLCTIPNVGWNPCTAGTSTLTAVAYGTAAVTGTAGWARFERIGTAGTFRLDGQIGVDSTNVFSINSAVFSTAGAPVALLTAPLYTI